MPMKWEMRSLAYTPFLNSPVMLTLIVSGTLTQSFPVAHNHLLEELNRQRTSTILGHSHVHRKNRNLPRTQGPVVALGPHADDLLGKSERFIAQNCFGHWFVENGKICLY